MKMYKYKAKRGPSEIVQGVMPAATKDEAVDKINDLGLVPVDVREAAAEKVSGKNVRPKGPKRLRGRQLITFYRQLSKLLKSGVPLLKSLTVIGDEYRKAHFKEMFDGLCADVRDGSTLSTAMGNYPLAFSSLDLGIIRAGEAAGGLDEALARMAQYHEKEYEIAGKIKSSLAYPAFILVAGVITACFMMIYVIPSFSSIFSSLGQELPAITKALIAVSGWFQVGWPWALIAFVGLGFLMRRALKNPKDRMRWHEFLLTVPKLGELTRKSDIACWARTLEMLLKSGIPILAALRQSAPALTNEVIRSELEECRNLVQEGGNLSDGLRRSKNFPGFVHQLIALGEQSGRLDEVLDEIADWYEKDTNETIKIMTDLLEPVIILLVGGVLGFIIMAVLLPVFSINTIVS